MRRSFAAIILLACATTSVFAHRLDEYLQATTVTLEQDRVVLQMRLAPGIQVFSKVMAVLDTDGNGIISEAEQKAYAERVGRDLALAIDGKRLDLRLISSTFPMLDKMKEGLGEILLSFEAALPHGGATRRLTLENHHQPEISAFLMNCLVPSDPNIRVTAQNRNYEQSFYQIDYTQPASIESSDHSGRILTGWLVADAVTILILVVYFWRRRSESGALSTV